MDLKKRFKYMTIIIIVIPIFAILVTFFAFMITRSVAIDESGDLSAPRYLQPTLLQVLTEGKVSGDGFSGIIMVFDDQAKMIYADPKVKKAMNIESWNNPRLAYSEMMAKMPARPFDVSVYRYHGKAGVVIFIEDYFTTVKLFRILWFVLFILYFFLIVIPVFMLRSFMRPLRKSLLSLEYAAQEIGRGNLDVEIIKGRKESKCRSHPSVLADLNTAFEKMRLELKENHEQQSRMIMSISHDLKTPLTLIKGYVEALKDGMAETPEDVAQYAEVIYDRSVLLEERISDLIHFARLRTTDWQTRFSPVSIKKFLKETSDIFKSDSFIRKRNFEYYADIPDEIQIMGDKKMIFQVLENLLDNSCRYTEEGDKIQLSSEVIKENLILILEDSGHGIGKDHIPYIFDNFYRADQGRNTRGLGIGLASARTIIQSHGGDITYMESSLGGAGFRVVIPLYVEASKTDT